MFFEFILSHFTFFFLGQLSVNAFITIMADTLTETTQWGNLKTDVSGYVGIDTLQDQIRKKVLKKGFEFNIIVVGELFIYIYWFKVSLHFYYFVCLLLYKHKI